MSFADSAISAFTESRSTFGVAVGTYDGNDYNGVSSVLSRERAYSMGGYENEFELIWRVLESDLAEKTANPRESEKVIIGGVTYRIVDSRTDPTGSIRRLDLTGEY